MDPMLASFISETRDNLETAGRCFLGLEKAPDDSELMDELFRSVHTIKGSSGLFDLPHFTAAVHIAEDLLDKARAGEFTLDSESIDVFLDTFDYIRDCIDELESDQQMSEQSIATAAQICAQLKKIQQGDSGQAVDTELTDSPVADNSGEQVSNDQDNQAPQWLEKFSTLNALDCAERLFASSENDDSTTKTQSEKLVAIKYTPASECFFAGDDPLHLVMQTPGLLHFITKELKPWGELDTLDPFKCNLEFYIVAALDESSETNPIAEHFKYIPDQIELTQFNWQALIRVSGEETDITRFKDSIAVLSDAINANDSELAKSAAQSLAELSDDASLVNQYAKWLCVVLSAQTTNYELLSNLLTQLKNQNPDFHFSAEKSVANETKSTSTDTQTSNSNRDSVSPAMLKALSALLQEQIDMLNTAGPAQLEQGKVASVISVLQNCVLNTLAPQLNISDDITAIFQQLASNKSSLIETSDKKSLIHLTESFLAAMTEAGDELGESNADEPAVKEIVELDEPLLDSVKEKSKTSKNGNKDKSASKVLRVDQSRIDSLMDLVGELIVAKNALPYLAKRAEEEFGSRVLAKEIKSQYSGLDRLADELQSAVMHIRLVPMTSVFQRFPRLVRDLSRKLGKQINLNLEGEDTEADKTIVEELSDPLIHLVRNSLDHGLETSEDRIAAGKPAVGTLTLRAIPKDDQVLIEVQDDGKGVDPEIIKHKAYTKGIIDEDRLENITDQEALQLIFAPGFSTAEQISDLSGRGVGMAVVKTVINQTGGTVLVESTVGVGTTIRLSLPLSMAVSRVMMLELHDQLYGISMDKIAETVRLDKKRVQSIKNKRAFVLRENLIPLFSLSQMLGMHYDVADETEELAIMVVNTTYGQIGVVIDEFHEGIDIIQKPLAGVMSGYPFYSGTALLGDGRVLLVLNMEELVACQ